eukprot:9109675-Pyramimonas_sp.AAC.1
MIADGPRLSRRKKAEGSGSMVRVPTPPAPPSGSAGAEQESRRDARYEQSSPTQVPSDEGTLLINDDGTTHVPQSRARSPPGASGHPEVQEMDVESEDSCATFPHEKDPQFLESMDDETFPHGPSSTNMFRRLCLRPTPDKRQGRPQYRDPYDGGREVTVGHAAEFKEKR